MQRVFRVVETAELTPMDLAPTDRMVASVRRYGVLAPVLLEERVDEDGVVSLAIVDGNRRVNAALQAGVERIPAIVFSQADPEAMAAMTLIANTLRSRNAISEWQAVEHLGDLGNDAEQIMHITGLTKASLETRLRPSAMHPDLRRALLDGRLNVTVWERAGKLPPESQQRLADVLEEKGGLRLADVDAERKLVEHDAPVRDDVEVPEVSEAPGTREQLADRLAELAAIAHSVGVSEYDWSRMATSAWRTASEPARSGPEQALLPEDES
jgi:ParB family chromosome partitioning protein